MAGQSELAYAGVSKNRIKYFKPEATGHEFSDHILVLPAVSVGNVGQLAVDLLIENMEPRPVKIGRIFHSALEPVIGTDADRSSLLTACEIFHQSTKKVIILQFHSPVTRRNNRQFIQFLVDWIQSSKFEQVVCLGSSMASLRNDVQLNDPAFRFLAGSTVNPSKLQEIIKLGWKKLESPTIQDWDHSSVDEVRIPGGGIMGDLFASCESLKISFLALLFFASDGDNTPEAMALFRSVNEIYNFVPVGKSGHPETELLIPISWNYSLGGIEPPGLF